MSVTKNKPLPKPPEFTPMEAVTAFCAWLTTRNYRTIMSASDSTSPIVELQEKFRKTYNLDECRPHWENLIKPIKEQD